MRGEIFDPLRKKSVAKTPEEEVRQNIIWWLNNERAFPLSLMMSEYSFHFNGLLYRADIVAFDREANPLLMVECKAPTVKINRDVVEQGIRYNIVLRVKYMMFTNGISSYLCRYNINLDKYEYVAQFPTYKEMLDD
jgi:hypothetical protein